MKLVLTAAQEKEKFKDLFRKSLHRFFICPRTKGTDIIATLKVPDKK